MVKGLQTQLTTRARQNAVRNRLWVGDFFFFFFARKCGVFLCAEERAENPSRRAASHRSWKQVSLDAWQMRLCLSQKYFDKLLTACQTAFFFVFFFFGDELKINLLSALQCRRWRAFTLSLPASSMSGVQRQLHEWTCCIWKCLEVVRDTQWRSCSWMVDPHSPPPPPWTTPLTSQDYNFLLGSALKRLTTQFLVQKLSNSPEPYTLFCPVRDLIIDGDQNRKCSNVSVCTSRSIKKCDRLLRIYRRKFQQTLICTPRAYSCT